MRPRRTCHAVPGSSERFLAKAPGLDADEVFLDLEDAVAQSEKENARRLVVEALKQDFGDKTVVLAGLVLMVAGGIVTALADQYAMALAGRVVAAAGQVLHPQGSLERQHFAVPLQPLIDLLALGLHEPVEAETPSGTTFAVTKPITAAP